MLLIRKKSINIIFLSFAGKSQPRQSSGTHALPSALEIAHAFRNVPEKAHESVTALLGAWSELLLHDLASTGNLKSQKCCSQDSTHGECYGRIGSNHCLEYMRSIPTTENDECHFGKFLSML